jgi:hypothetical protein
MPDDAAPKPRTIDERLDGLTQTLEIIGAMQQDNQKRFEEVAMMQLDNEKRFAEIATALQQDAENIRALARIAELHDRRLTGLEDQQQ